jgi:hypothetical protein
MEAKALLGSVTPEEEKENEVQLEKGATIIYFETSIYKHVRMVF